MSEIVETDVLIIGGGLAGLALTARLASTGTRAVCVDTGPMPSAETASREQRTTAILMPGIETLTKAGAWPLIGPDAQALRGMQILDCGGATPVPRDEAMFDAAEIGGEAFGWNVENGKARLAMAQRIETLADARFLPETTLQSHVTREDGVFATLSDGASVRAKLLVGADGRGSAVRANAGIGLRKWGYAQKALACRVHHTRPHEGVSIEMHHVGGPLTFAPLQGGVSGLVWMNADGEADRLAALDDTAFLDELNSRSNGVYGEITHAAPRALWPATTQVATDLIARRTALVAEAAHAFPPIGAQGFNLSLRDIETLAQLCEGAEDTGADSLLATYKRRRTPDILARTAGVDLLNRSVRTTLRPVRDLRRLGLSVLGRTPPLRKLAMTLGMGRS